MNEWERSNEGQMYRRSNYEQHLKTAFKRSGENTKDAAGGRALLLLEVEGRRHCCKVGRGKGDHRRTGEGRHGGGCCSENEYHTGGQRMKRTGRTSLQFAQCNEKHAEGCKQMTLVRENGTNTCWNATGKGTGGRHSFGQGAAARRQQGDGCQLLRLGRRVDEGRYATTISGGMA